MDDLAKKLYNMSDSLSEQECKNFKSILDKLFHDDTVGFFDRQRHIIESFKKEFRDSVDSDTLATMTQYLWDTFFHEYQGKLNWNLISKGTFHELSESSMRKFKDRVVWDIISREQKLSEDFIREFKDRVNWKRISRFQKLSEDFIREFQDKVDWSNIEFFHILSDDFVREFKDKIPCYKLLNE